MEETIGTTRVWEINSNYLVVADNIQEAINLYEEKNGPCSVSEIKQVTSSSWDKSTVALIRR